VNILRLSLNLLRRDWRAGEWRVLLLALVLAVGSLSTVGLFADRVRLALQQEATSLIGADLRISSTRPLPALYRETAVARKLLAVESLSFPSMVAFGEQTLLSSIKTVETGYPLRGKITINDGNEHVADYIPQPGTVWAGERLLRRLGVQIGDAISIGERQFVVAAKIVKDIDQSISFSSFAPRALMNMQDLASTGLMQEGSRVQYRLMIAGDDKQVEALSEDLKMKLSGSEQLENVRDARPEIRTALDRAEHFLGLAALTAAILAGAAILLAARRFVQRHLDGCAVMRCLGAQQGQILRLFLYQLMLLGLVGVLLGCVLGYFAQALLISTIEAMRDASFPQPGILPAFKAAASGFALLFGFAFLPLLQLRKVSPLRVLRREMGAPEPGAIFVYGIALVVLSGLFMWHAGSLKLGFVVLGGLLAGLNVFGGLAWLILHGLGRYVTNLSAHWRHAVSNLVRHGRSNALQVVALALGGMALLVLTLVRGDLLQGWQDKLPPDTPNRFVVNIQPDQRQPVLDFFASQQLPAPQLLPMVRGRLVEINGMPVKGGNYTDPRARGLVEREFNLSYMEKMPEWNELVSGTWWSENRSSQLSVEQGIAETLGIKLGDELTYNVAGSRFKAKVSNFRKVQWDSMRVNFFVITTPDLLRDFPTSYLSSFYLPPDKVSAGDMLSQQFSNLLLIDTGAIIVQVRSIMSQIAQMMGAVFLFTLLSGLAVLYAALLATQDERTHEAVVLRTLGADGQYIRRLHFAEFTVLGGLSGLFAASGAVLLGWLLARFVLEIPYQPSAMIWLIGVLGGMVIVALAGWLGTRQLSEMSPIAILREQNV